MIVPAIAKNPPFNKNNVPAAIPRPFRTLSLISSNFLPFPSDNALRTSIPLLANHPANSVVKNCATLLKIDCAF